MCAVSGTIEMKMVAHVYRQEVYAGKHLENSPYSEHIITGGSLTDKQQINVSPINFFRPKMKTYPNFSAKDMTESYTVSEGDCIFIPAYYFH